jgi:hypothetical protein
MIATGFILFVFCSCVLARYIYQRNYL